MENRLVDFHLIHIRGRDYERLAVLTPLSFLIFDDLYLWFSFRLLVFGFFDNFDTLNLDFFMLNWYLLGFSQFFFSKLNRMIDRNFLSKNFLLNFQFFRKNNIRSLYFTFLEYIIKFFLFHLSLNFPYSTFINLKRWFNLFCNFNGLRKTLLDVDIVDFGASA
jgi:hypothetical protein